jgi:hypothetical protein
MLNNVEYISFVLLVLSKFLQNKHYSNSKAFFDCLGTLGGNGGADAATSIPVCCNWAAKLPHFSVG